MTDLSSIASCPIWCIKRRSFRVVLSTWISMLSISLQGRRILLLERGRWNWQRVGASPKIIWRERSTPVCCPNYTTNTKGAFFWEKPKTDLWSQIIRILHYQKNGRSEKGSWQRNVLVLLVKKKTTNWSSRRRQEEKATWARNEYTKCIYNVFRFETQTFLK